jgi:RNA binding exosome subunit
MVVDAWHFKNRINVLLENTYREMKQILREWRGYIERETARLVYRDAMRTGLTKTTYFLRTLN